MTLFETCKRNQVAPVLTVLENLVEFVVIELGQLSWRKLLTVGHCQPTTGAEP